MSKRNVINSLKSASGFFRNALPLAKRVARSIAKALVSRRGVTTSLTIIIAIELVVFGAGVSRRLEQTYNRAAELSQLQLAAIEAEGLANELKNRGAVGIGARDASSPPQEQEDPSAPPPLRARDVEMIVAQEAGASEEELAEATQPASDESNEAQEANPAPASNRLTREDQEELDILIRQGVSSMIAGDMRQTIMSLEEAYMLNPDHPALLYYYGMAYDKLLNPAKAREYYTKVFQMREQAGKYFQRASRRLTYGFEQPYALRGKLAFGPYQMSHTIDAEQGEQVHILLPVMLAPGEEVRPDDIYITIQFFDIADGKKIEFSRLSTPQLSWQKDKPDWSDWEENLQVTYKVPPLNKEELDAYGDLRYYGFTAKLYFKGEPLDCISSPSALILQEQRLNKRKRQQYNNGILPDDGLDPSAEEAIPASDFLQDIAPDS